MTATGSTVSAVSGNNYVTVWGNEVPDASFGVTSPITLTDIEPQSRHVFATLSVPTGQVVTSFSSKSELALHYTRDRNGGHLIFVGYGLAGVGALDVSNADAVQDQDVTNPVTFAFGTEYAFPRTIVSLDDKNHFSYTPTVNYGGNNGRAALLGSNGLYYTVGNANNGNASTFGSNTNFTHPDVTETTGVEAVSPIDASSANVAVPTGNSAEVNPLLQLGEDKGKADKAGKDDNFRGITEHDGALYFTKGSGSNGIQTVYTITTGAQYAVGAIPQADVGPSVGNVLPSVADAGNVAVQVVNGFPVDSARTAGGDYTPFAIFFANDHTMYVTDEGTGDATDTASPPAGHAGLEKWSLVNGTWQLDYVLTNRLIGASYGPLFDSNGRNPWPAVTNVGLRNLAGRLNGDGTVTLWAVTSTTDTNAANTDVGADPNEVVEITDVVAATSATRVANESFSVVASPVYGKVYRGVAYVASPGK
ncbi:MAG TPA: hypothetical protein VMS16_04910 [Mycobacterium sp.]|nr:hypothetical protein [Mycobacterium sp.]